LKTNGKLNEKPIGRTVVGGKKSGKKVRIAAKTRENGEKSKMGKGRQTPVLFSAHVRGGERSRKIENVRGRNSPIERDQL